MAEIIRSTNNVEAAKDAHGIVPGYQELPSPPEPALGRGDDVLTENQGGSRWSISENAATYICACGTTTRIPVGYFTKFPLNAKCCKDALNLERQ